MKVLFVCIGNSCRSPMAESVLKSMASEHGLTDWYVDSAALREWNVGRGPEERALAVLAEHGLTSDHVGRLIGADDFRQFDYVFGMDESNVADLLHRAPVDGRAKIELLGNYRGKELDRIIIDPYFLRNATQTAPPEMCNSLVPVPQHCGKRPEPYETMLAGGNACRKKEKAKILHSQGRLLLSALPNPDGADGRVAYFQALSP
uniref:Phosphotyrosine protein phosphatase I domain-containing protein n=1 Tax=Anopheles coluzzii TaxID=1518534 RepID=A0A8W7PJB9_ANOCL